MATMTAVSEDIQRYEGLDLFKNILVNHEIAVQNVLLDMQSKMS